MLFYLFSLILIFHQISLASFNVVQPIMLPSAPPVGGWRNEEIKYPYSLGPVLESKSALVIDQETDKILFSKNKDEVLPIASLTKLMTTLVFLDNRNVDWDQWVSFKKGDRLEPSWINVSPNNQVKVRDIFRASLVGSANDAAFVLSRLIKNPDNFVNLMNKQAEDLGMRQTKFFEPTGLNPQNSSTVQDLSLLVKEAFERKEIKEALEKKEIVFQVKRPDKSFYWRRLKNSNKLLNSFINLKAKTGYLEESGYCLAGLKNNKIVIILNASDSQTRFVEAKILSWWAEVN